MMHRPAIKAGLELASRAGQNPVAAQATTSSAPSSGAGTPRAAVARSHGRALAPDLFHEAIGVLEVTSESGHLQGSAECVAARLVVGASRPPDQVRQQHGAGR